MAKAASIADHKSLVLSIAAAFTGPIPGTPGKLSTLSPHNVCSAWLYLAFFLVIFSTVSKSTDIFPGIVFKSLSIDTIILLPLMLWFIFNFIAIYDQSYEEVLKFFSNSTTKFLFSLFIVFAYFFSSLSISEVFEDYIGNDKIKNVANRLLFLSAIIIPLLTIISLFNLN